MWSEILNCLGENVCYILKINKQKQRQRSYYIPMHNIIIYAKKFPSSPWVEMDHGKVDISEELYIF